MAYDLGDNMTAQTKYNLTNVMSDSFADGNVTSNPAWTTTGTWSVVSGAARNTLNSSSVSALKQLVSQTDGEYRFQYAISSASSSQSARIGFRNNDAENTMVRVDFWNTQTEIFQFVNGTYTSLNINTAATSALDTAYDVYIRARGSNIEVWRGLAGQAKTLIASTDDCTVLSGTRFCLEARPNAQISYDNVDFRAHKAAANRTANQWYDVHVVMDRGKVEVWRRAQGASADAYIYTVTSLLRTKSSLHLAVFPICAAVPPCEKEILTQRRQGTENATAATRSNGLIRRSPARTDRRPYNSPLEGGGAKRRGMFFRQRPKRHRVAMTHCFIYNNHI